MIFKIMAFLAAAIPIFLFVRSVFSTHDADQRRSQGIKLSIPTWQSRYFWSSSRAWWSCRWQVGLDVVVVILTRSAMASARRLSQASVRRERGQECEVNSGRFHGSASRAGMARRAGLGLLPSNRL